MKKRIITLVFIILTAVSFALAQSKPNASGYAPVNGQKVYYEIYGQGTPIVLLHGAYMTIGLNWGPLIPELSKTHRVIAIEVQGHGHTPWTNRPLTLEAVADDVDKTLQYLKIDSADIVGYSYGGSLAYTLAIKNPKRVNKLVIISSTYKSEGWQKEVRDAMQGLRPEFLTNTPLHDEYKKVAPDTTQWNAFLTGMIEFVKKHFDLGDQNIKNIKSPVLIIAGDNDGIDKPVLMQTYSLLGGNVFADMGGLPKSQLAIVPAQGHVSVMMQTDVILGYLKGFLK